MSRGERIDWEGLRFGRLTVMREDPTNKCKVVCRCDCGKTTSVFKTNLRSGNTKSCGCYHSEIASKIGKEHIAENRKEYLDLISKFDTNFSIIERKEPRANNTSGRTGVCFITKLGRYVARLRIQGHMKYLGSFSKYQDAVAAREKAEKEYFDPLIEAKNEYLESKDETTRAQREYQKWKHLASYMR